VVGLQRGGKAAALQILVLPAQDTGKSDWKIGAKLEETFQTQLRSHLTI
jgi:hypothetical protein